MFNVRFPGQYFDEERGLHYNRWRYYDTSIGRYISADPVLQGGGVNVFQYSSNNPIGRSDPFGLIDELGFFPPPPHKPFNEWIIELRDAVRAEAVEFAGPQTTEAARAKADAVQHCIGACVLSRQLGERASQAIGDFNELQTRMRGENSPEDEKMDQENNRVGRGLGGGTAGNDVCADLRDCRDLCEGAWRDGNLTVEGFNSPKVPGPYSGGVGGR